MALTLDLHWPSSHPPFVKSCVTLDELFSLPMPLQMGTHLSTYLQCCNDQSVLLTTKGI
jgi:hypothetical protein